MTSEVSRLVDDGPATVPSASARRERIGWLRGIVTAVAIFVVAFVGGVLVPNELVGMSSTLSLDTRALFATLVGIGVVIVMAFALRKLQARGWI